jgi:hypothetical protein
MAGQSKADENPGLVGWIGALLFFLAIGYGLYQLYATYLKSRPAVVSLSAYFVDDPANTAVPADCAATHLKIAGNVYQAGQPLKSANVRLTVTKQDRTFQQTIAVDLEKTGAFKSEDAAFRTLRPGDALGITAEVSSDQLSETAIGTVYWNTRPPALTPIGEDLLWVVLCILIFVFFYSFTGRRTPLKNRVAIIFSYIVILLFLGIPLLAPVLLLHAFPNLRPSMIGSPVGLVVTKVGDPANAQWAFNIGGYSTIGSATSATGASGPSGPTGASGPASASGPSSGIGPSGAKSGSGPSGPSGSAPSRGPIGATAPAADASSPRSNACLAIAANSPENPVKVEGGLVIPLYVIILSVIGGAINMTRKVPRLQREGESAEVPVPLVGKRTAKRIESMVATATKGLRSLSSSAGPELKPEPAPPPAAAPAPVAAPPAPPHAEAADAQPPAKSEKPESARPAPVPKPVPGDIDVQLDQMVKDQLKRNNETDQNMENIRELVEQMRSAFDARKDNARILGFASFEEWLANRVSLRELLGSNWRVELLNQYMYLISAPFLAIVAYYMLDLAGFSKQQVLVLISFSVGLISERILSWLLSMATGYLRSDAGAAK